MGNDLLDLAKSLGGGNEKISLENVARLLSGENGKKVLAALLSDGGDRVRRAAESAKRGDSAGVSEIIKSISETPEGASLLGELRKESERG